MSDSRAGEPSDLPSIASPPPEQADCWRCGKQFDATAIACPYCRARHAPRVAFDSPLAVRETGVGVPPIDPTSPAIRLIGYYAALLLMSIVFAAIVRVRFPAGEDLSPADQVWLMYATLVLEAVDTVIVIAAWSALRRPAVPENLRSPALAWTAAVPALTLLLALNFGYHWLLTQLVPSLDKPEQMLPGREWLYLISYGLQPAMVEEAFFRGLALDWFRTVTTTRAALIISSVMFGLCHIYAPISVPYLITAGIVFGAARLYSGGLLLPMILHFLHNFVVVLVEHYRA